MPFAATLVSVENAITGTLRLRATWPTKLTDCANSGPIMIWAPWSSTCWAASCAAWAVPPSSFTNSWMFGLLKSAIAMSAALRIDWPARPALPGADSGRIRPALTWPAPMVVSGGVCGLCGGESGDRYWEFCEQPASNAPALASMPAIERRRVGRCCLELAANAPGAGTCKCADADTAVFSPRRPTRVDAMQRQRQSDILGANG